MHVCSACLYIRVSVLYKPHAAEPRSSGDQFKRHHSLPILKDTSLQTSSISDRGPSLRHPWLHSAAPNDGNSLDGSVFDLLSYSDVDTGQRQEFHFLLARVCACFARCLCLPSFGRDNRATCLKRLWDISLSLSL